MSRLTFKKWFKYFKPYEKITTICIDGYTQVDEAEEEINDTVIRSNHYYLIGEAVDKLADYEDAEEQGLLLRLPCKVGDTVYTIKDFKVVTKGIVNELFFSNKMELFIVVNNGTSGAFGKTVFLTREEAEAALKKEIEEKMILYRMTNVKNGIVHEGTAEELGTFMNMHPNTIRTAACHKATIVKTWNVERMGDAEDFPDHAQRLGLARKCMICGKDFVAKRPDAQICSATCKSEAEKIRKKRVAEANKNKPTPEPKKPKKKKALTVWQINQAARAVGMTYGQYVAKYKL